MPRRLEHLLLLMDHRDTELQEWLRSRRIFLRRPPRVPPDPGQTRAAYLVRLRLVDDGRQGMPDGLAPSEVAGSS